MNCQPWQLFQYLIIFLSECILKGLCILKYNAMPSSAWPANRQSALVWWASYLVVERSIFPNIGNGAKVPP